MVINSSTVGMDSVGSYRASSVTLRRFRVTDYQETLEQKNNALNTAVGGSKEDAAGQQTKAGDTAADKDGTQETAADAIQEWNNRFGITKNRISLRNPVDHTIQNIRQYTIRSIFDMLFAARRGRLNQWRAEHGLSTNDASYSYAGYNYESYSTSWTQGDALQQPQKLNAVFSGNLKVLTYSSETWQMKEEAVNFATTGTVHTADGREIQFNVNIGMSSSFEQYFREDLEAVSLKLCDPLVLNFDTDVASLSDQTFFFDIDADGEKDEIASLGAGSGYLALDKNGDGVINDGSELFGTESGNGFADLAKYDQDGNGWIDENDAVWSMLKIWCKDEQGNDALYGLAEKGVGAICLQNAATNFELRDGAGQTSGAIRSTGVFLYENGNVGTVQHLDVAKYTQSA